MHTHKTTHLQSHTHTDAPTHTVFLTHTHTQTRKEQQLLRNEPWHCLSQSEALIRICSQDLLLSTHTNTHKIWEGRGGAKKKKKKEKAKGHVGGKRGTRQHLQSPLLIALLPAWSQITGLEMLQSGLYLLANLPPPQIHTSKPPSYHLLVNLQRRKGHRDTLKSNSFPSISPFLSSPASLSSSVSIALLSEVRYTHDRVFPGLEGFRAMLFFFFFPFCPPSIFPLSWSFDVRRLESQILVHLASEIIP